MTITVYSAPNCVQCSATYRALDKHDIRYEVIDLAENDELRERLKTEGLMAAPIVEAGDERWVGFRPDKIRALASQLHAA